MKRFLPWLVAITGATFVLHASYPGYLNADSYNQLQQIVAGRYDDWHSPFIALVWSGLNSLYPGPFGFVLLVNGLIWGSLAAISAHTMRLVGLWALPLVLLPMVPGLFNFLGHVHKDAMLVGWLLMACACSFAARTSRRSRAGRLFFSWLSVAAMIAAYQTRPNAVFCLLPLMLYLPIEGSQRRRLMLMGALLASLPALYALESRVLDVKQRQPSESIKLYHLIAQSYFTDRNLLPGGWTEAESSAIVTSCYSPVQWDAAIWGHCQFVHQRLVQEGLWGSRDLTLAWVDAMVSHPLASYSTLAALFRLSTREPNSRVMLRQTPERAPDTWKVDLQPARQTTQWAEAYIGSRLTDRASRPWWFATVSLLSLLLLLGRGCLHTPLGQFSAVVLASGALYMCTYFPFNVSAEYRYFYWSGFAAYLGLAAALLACRAQRDAETISGLLPRWLLIASVAVPFALTAAPFKLPTERREISVIPLDSGPAAVLELRTASAPAWSAVRVEGHVEGDGWSRRNGALESTSDAEPLQVTMTTLHQTLRLRLASGPGRGRVQVNHDGQLTVVDARTPAAGEIVLGLPIPDRLRGLRRHASWLAPLRALAWLLALAGLFIWLGRDARRWDVLAPSTTRRVP